MKNRQDYLDEKYMRLTLGLAKKAGLKALPNPLVGCVIVKNNRILSCGYHGYFGGPHAEIEALNRIKNNAVLKGSTIYINLEPCCHYGKTPPCTGRMLNSGIKRAVIAMPDPNPEVNGKGMQILRKNGIEVKAGVLEKQAKELNKVFIKYITKKMPYVVIKSAMSLDGKIADKTGGSKWISSEKAREYVYKLRQQSNAVMAGINTVLKDDPLLTTHGKYSYNPKRIIIDPRLRINPEARACDTSIAETIIITGNKINRKKYGLLLKKNLKILTFDLKNGIIDFKNIAKKLIDEGIYSLLVEGGGETNYSVLKSGIADEMLCFVAPIIITGRDAKTPVEGEGIRSIKDSIKGSFSKEIKFFDTTLLIKLCLQE